MQPEICRCGRSKGERVVLYVVLADEDRHAVGGGKGEGLRAAILVLLGHLLVQIARGDQLLLNLRDLSEPRGGVERCLDAFEMADVRTARILLDGEELLRALQLVVLLIVGLHVLDDAQTAVERDGERFSCLAVDVRDRDCIIGMIHVVVLIGHEVVGGDLLLLGVFGGGDLRAELFIFLPRAGELRAHEAAKALAVGDDVAAKAPIRVDHESADRGIGEESRFRQGAERERRHRRDFAVFVKAQGGGGLFHPCAQFGQCICERGEVRIVQLSDRDVWRESGEKGRFLCRDGAEAEDGADECLKEFCLPLCSDTRENVLCVCREEVAFFLRRREDIGKPLVDGAHAARVLTDAPQCLGDDAVLVEDDVAVLADELECEGARNDAATTRDDVNVEMDDAVTSLLTHGGDAPCLKLLAQEHDEGRRLGRVLGSRLDEVRRGVARICIDIEQQVLSRLADAEDDGLLVRLIDLVDASARESICELTHEGGHGESVKAHRITFLSLGLMRKIIVIMDKFQHASFYQ